MPPSTPSLVRRLTRADRAKQHTNVPVEFEKFNVSGETPEDAAVFKRSMDSLRRNKVGLKGELPRTTRSHRDSSFLIHFLKTQVSSTPPSSDLATPRGTSPCVNNSTFTRPLSSASRFPVSLPVTATSTLPSSVKTPRENTLVSSTKFVQLALFARHLSQS